jgi:dihydroneopterin aldolase/2-amino-4-hydroxy-6-hydroxymethyldihydropteridine diphosphokinase
MNMIFYGYHGVAAAERETGRRYEVDCEIKTDFAKAARSDHLDDAINYLSIYKTVEDFLENHRYNLLETLAERLREEIQKKTGASNVTLRVRKRIPPVPGNIDYVEVETSGEKLEVLNVANVFLGLGANEGDTDANIRKAIDLLNQSEGIRIKAVSSLYESAAVGVSEQPDYVNCVIKIETGLKPHAVLKITKSIEAALGRQPDTHTLPRPMDIDILLYGDIDLDSLDLMIPHSRLKTRRFVLEPLLEIAPDAIDPVTSRPLREFLDDVMSQKMIKVKNPNEVWDG